MIPDDAVSTETILTVPGKAKRHLTSSGIHR